MNQPSCLAWNTVGVCVVGAPNNSLHMLNKLQKRICKTVARNIAGLSLFYRYYFGRCSSALAKLVPTHHSHGLLF